MWEEVAASDSWLHEPKLDSCRLQLALQPFAGAIQPIRIIGLMDKCVFPRVKSPGPTRHMGGPKTNPACDAGFLPVNPRVRTCPGRSSQLSSVCHGASTRSEHVVDCRL